MKDRIYIKHWLELKPENYSGSTDLYYLKIANKIYSNFSSDTKNGLTQIMDKEAICTLCCFITCYFEDVISEINIWQTFKNEYAKNYNKSLPFFDLDENYIEDEINTEDIAVLIWYFTNSIHDDRFFNPHNNFVMAVAQQAMEILEKEYEFAPENKALKQFYQLFPTTEDFYEIRHFIHNLYFESYLFYPDIKKRYDNSVMDIIEMSKDENPEILMSYIREITEDYTFNQPSALLAINAKDWAKSMLGKSHKKYASVNSISNKIRGFFLYKKQDDTNVFFEHIASSLVFEMTKKSFDHYKDLKKDDIIYIGLVKFDNEWWFSGNFQSTKFDADIILDEKNSALARAEVNFLRDENEIKAIINKQKNAFLAFNDNSLVAFVKNNNLKTFLDDYIAFFNDSLQLSEKDIEEADKRVRADGYFGADSESNLSDKNDEELVVFFNPVAGFEIYSDVVNAFPDKRNPFFTKETHEDVQHILISKDCSTELAHYVIDNYKDKLTYFEKEPYKSYLDDLDFLLKFWKKENYKSKHSLILTGKGN